MGAMRDLCRRSPMTAAVLIALALLMRLLVPGGSMPRFDAQGLRLVVCTGEATHVEIDVPLGQAHDHGAPPQGDLHKAGPCAFAGLSAPVLGGAGPLLLATAILAAFAAALWRRPILAPRAPAALRPPLRGPPATA